MNQHAPVVVVINNDASVRDSLAELVRSTGMSVEAFGSAQEFLTRARPDGTDHGATFQFVLSARGGPTP